MSRKRPRTFFGSSTPRSGGALVSNVLSAHKDILITTDFVHCFRHIYEKYSPISKTSNQFKLVNEMCLRLKYRQRVNVNPKEILSYFENINNYRDVVDALSNFILSKNPNKKIIGESSNGEWRNIDLFLKLDKNYKSYQVIRDPRAAMTSWKNITFSEKGSKLIIDLVLPIPCQPLKSIIAIKLFNFLEEANKTDSQTVPSLHSPSPSKTKVLKFSLSIL